MAPASKSSLVIGVLLLSDEGVQYLDMGAVDLFASMSKLYFQAVGLPEAIQSQAIECDFHYISETGEGLFPLTGSVRIAVTDSIKTAPPLDILIIPGPPPSFVASDAVTSFMRKQVDEASAVLCICTGMLPFAQSGAVKGKTVTAPLPLIPMLQQRYPDTTWVDRRWTQDGKIWTSGGVTNGLEMTAAFMRSFFWDRREGVETTLGMINVGDKGQEYTEAEKNQFK